MAGAYGIDFATQARGKFDGKTGLFFVVKN
jgi:hypothetical protein